MRPAHPITELLPHRSPMMLLDELLEHDEETALAATTIRDTSLFLEAEGVPAHVGLEYMAQACGAHVGALARAQDKPVKIGFLLGTRQFRAHVPFFLKGARLNISVKVAYRDTDIGVYDCVIEIDGAVVADAQLTVYQPDRIEPDYG